MDYGIVMVSHVSSLVAGVDRLIKEVAKTVSVTTAGGLEGDEIGTSFEAILAAIENNEAEHILAFYDLGSAKMNLEMAAEMTDKKITIYDTAFVESSYTAAALIQAGAPIEAIEQQLAEMKIK